MSIVGYVVLVVVNVVVVVAVVNTVEGFVFDVVVVDINVVVVVVIFFVLFVTVVYFVKFLAQQQLLFLTVPQKKLINLALVNKSDQRHCVWCPFCFLFRQFKNIIRSIRVSLILLYRLFSFNLESFWKTPHAKLCFDYVARSPFDTI